jgi:hypothetical protein
VKILGDRSGVVTGGADLQSEHTVLTPSRIDGAGECGHLALSLIPKRRTDQLGPRSEHHKKAPALPKIERGGAEFGRKSSLQFPTAMQLGIAHLLLEIVRRKITSLPTNEFNPTPWTRLRICDQCRLELFVFYIQHLRHHVVILTSSQEHQSHPMLSSHCF